MLSLLSFRRIVIVGQLILIAALLWQLAIHQQRFTYISSPVSNNDVQNIHSDRYTYFYDLAAESAPVNPPWLGYTPVYIRNKDALNDRFDYIPGPHPGSYRIITLGDSWTFGMFVSTKDSYSERLEDLLNTALDEGKIRCDGIKKIEVLNFGVGGYDLAYMIERLRLRGMKYQPDLIIPLVKYDDFFLVDELYKKKIAEIDTKTYKTLEPRVENGVAINPKQELTDRITEEFNTKYSVKELADQEAKSLQDLERFYTGSTLFAVYNKLDPAHSKILDDFLAHNRSASVVMLSSPLPPDEVIPHDGHPNVKGHAKIAGEIYAQLIQKRILPCTSE